MSRHNVATVEYQCASKKGGHLIFKMDGGIVHLIYTNNPVEALTTIIRMAAGVHPKSDPTHPMRELTADSKQSAIKAILSHHDRMRRGHEQIGIEAIKSEIRGLRRQFGKILDANKKVFEGVVDSLTMVVDKVAEEATSASGGGEVEEDEEGEEPATGDTNPTPPPAGI